MRRGEAFTAEIRDLPISVSDIRDIRIQYRSITKVFLEKSWEDCMVDGDTIIYSVTAEEAMQFYCGPVMRAITIIDSEEFEHYVGDTIIVEDVEESDDSCLDNLYDIPMAQPEDEESDVVPAEPSVVVITRGEATIAEISGLSFPLVEVQDIQVVYHGITETFLQKGFADCIVDGETITYELTEDDTLALSCGPVSRSITIISADGEVHHFCDTVLVNAPDEEIWGDDQICCIPIGGHYVPEDSELQETHGHINKDVLDSITQDMVDGWNSGTGSADLSGLADVAKSGLISDLRQKKGTYIIIDAGTSSTVI